GDLLLVEPHGAKPLAKAFLADNQSFEQFAAARSADERDPGKAEVNGGVWTRQDVGERVSHDLPEVGQRPSQALAARVVAGRAPKRVLKEGSGTASIGSRREQCE